MITRIPLRCLACNSPLTIRVQVGHELAQPVASVCVECFTPIRLRLLLEEPPRVGIEFVENCAATDAEGVVVNVGAGFLIPRARRNEEAYFPSFDLPKPDEAVLQRILAERPADAIGPIAIDLTVLLGGMPKARDRWHQLKNAYRFARTGQVERMRAVLLEQFDLAADAEDLTIEGALISFFVRFLEPSGETNLQRALTEIIRARALDANEFDRLLADFRPTRWDRLDEYMDILDHFFRGYEEFNQALIYVRRDIPMPEDPYAPSVDFEHTKLYYGEAFEVLGSSIDLLAAINNIAAGRPYDRMTSITLQAYRTADKGRRNSTLANNPELAWLVSEYDNRVRNASHHRWLRLSQDRSEISYREGGDGALRRFSYAEYLHRCCSITAQLMLLASIEATVLRE